MKFLASTLAAALIGTAAQAVVIDFESLSDPNDISVAAYSESTFDFASSTTSGFGSWGTTSVNSTGSTGLFNDSFIGATTTMTQTDGLEFTVKTIALSELFFFSPTSSVTFTGTTSTGGTVQQTFDLDGTFGNETFSFSAAFTDLVALEWDQTSAFHQFDDIRVHIDSIPLPAGGTLLLSALGGIFLLRRRKRES